MRWYIPQPLDAGGLVGRIGFQALGHQFILKKHFKEIAVRPARNVSPCVCYRRLQEEETVPGAPSPSAAKWLATAITASYPWGAPVPLVLQGVGRNIRDGAANGETLHRSWNSSSG